MKKVKEVVMYEAENGVLYKTKEDAEFANKEIAAMYKLGELASDVWIDKDFDVAGFILENREKILNIINF